MKKTLVVGWFSFEQMGATAGDLLARDVVCDWLSEAGIPYEVATAAPFGDGVDVTTVQPSRFDRLLFVCGPFGNGPPLVEMLERFEGCEIVGVDVSMLQPLDEWNPFDLLLERNSSAAARPDISFAAPLPDAPVVGVVRVHPQDEYGARARHKDANAAIDRLLDAKRMAAVQIDTRLDENAVGLRTPVDVETAVGRMDAIVTTRLHGMVLALRQGVPPVVIDPIAGGAKVITQARRIGWPLAFTVEEATDEILAAALDQCLQPSKAVEARQCAAAARAEVEQIRDEFVTALRAPETE